MIIRKITSSLKVAPISSFLDLYLWAFTLNTYHETAQTQEKSFYSAAFRNFHLEVGKHVGFLLNKGSDVCTDLFTNIKHSHVIAAALPQFYDFTAGWIHVHSAVKTCERSQ